MSYEVELPGVYLDALVLDESVGIVLANRDPGPGDQAVPFRTTIALDVVVTDGGYVDVATLLVYVRVGELGVEELAYDGSTGFQAGWDGDEAVAYPTDPATYRVVVAMDPEGFPSLEVVTVRVEATSTAGVVLVDGSYSFVVEDLDAPAAVQVQATGRQTLRVTFDEPVADSAVDASRYGLEALTVPAVTPVVVAARRVDAAVIDLTLDNEQTMAATYRLTATQIADTSGNVATSLTDDFAAYRCPVPAGRRMDLYAMLPVINRRADVLGDLERFMACFQDVLDNILCDIDEWTRIIDPDRAPEPYLDAMLATLGNPFVFVLTANEKRKLIRVLVAIYKTKGTEAGIIDAVRLFLGIDVTIETANLEAAMFDVDLFDDAEFGISNISLLFEFDVVSPQALTDTERERIIVIAKYMKPVNMRLGELREPEPDVVVDHAQFDLSTFDLDALLH